MKIIVDFAAIVGVLVTLMYLVTSGAAVSKFDPCVKYCPLIFDPVCAYTGNGVWQTFPNKCVADVQACYDGKMEYKPYYYGKCIIY